MKQLSGRVDLTENRDFGGQLRLSDMLGINFGFDTLGRAVRPNSLRGLSGSEFERLRWREKFFGVMLHTDEFWEVFKREDEEAFFRNEEHHCRRCGVEFRAPWKNHDGLCKKCSDAVDGSLRNIPWRMVTSQVDARSVFLMK